MSGPAYDLLLRGAMIVDAQGQGVGDLAITGEKIIARAERLENNAARVIEGAGHFILPGYIDAHVHLNEPGRAEWEGFASGTAALAAGGCTCFVDMPLNSTPVLDAPSFAAKAAALQKHSRLDGAIWGGLTPLNLGQMKELAVAGVIGFKAFMSDSGMDDFPRCDSATLREGMDRAADLRLPVAVHAESDDMTQRLAAERRARGACGIRDYLDSRPIAAELAAIHEALDLAARSGCALHVVHVSSSEGLKMIAEARRNGVDVTAETCPHYLLLDESDLFRLGAVAKCAPPLRSAGERQKLWNALEAGRVDTIGSDHSPSPPEMKRSDDFFRVWGGIAGCQHNYALLFEEAVLKRKLTPSLIARLTSLHVAQRFKLPGKGGLQVGDDADLVVLQPDAPHEIETSDLLTRHALSPYVGRSTQVKVAMTIAGGRIVHGPGSSTPSRPARILRPTSST